MKYLCTGDLHLTERSSRGPEWLDRQRDVWQKIITLAVEHNVDALLFAGDAFEHRHPTPREIMAFKAPLEMLHCPVIAVAGNHDVVKQDYPTALEVVLGSAVARTPRVINGVACLPWTPSREPETAELLVRAAEDLRSEADVLMLHWSVSGFSLPNGLPVDQLREPVLDQDALRGQGWDHIVMGHIHKADVSDPAMPNVFYVGSPMCLNFGEANVDHGCWIIDGYRLAEFIPLDGPRFVTLEADDVPDPNEPDTIYRYRPQVVQREISRAPGLNEDVDELTAAGLYCKAQEIEPEPVLEHTAAYLEMYWRGR